MAKPKNVSPRGTAKYPHLHAPDYKFAPEKGEFHVDLVVAPGTPGLEEFITFLDEQHDLSIATLIQKKPKDKSKLKKGTPPYKVDEESGEYIFKFVTQASGVNKKTNKPWKKDRISLIDSRGAVVKNEVRVGGGSTIKVSFTPVSTEFQNKAHVKLFLDAVQVLDLKTWGDRDGASYGFAAEEDGYDASEFVSEETETETVGAPAVDDKGGDF